ncbi:hypothetical protein V502_03865 [Pseudogymnoascus sp. VKM F-4520 (FW-2644)]|nr:hypothetical protein V502_03865 [Pseudogymnoascus sp. VKM F-4520 (FW-2644)]
MPSPVMAALAPVDEEEDPERYVPGGFYPVHLDDEYHNGRYRVLRKLGHGRYSTVWLVRNQQSNTYQALKILSSDCYRPDPSQPPFELSILQHLSTAGPSHPGFPFVPQLRDHFELTGPNGTHVCLMLDPMGSEAVHATAATRARLRTRGRGDPYRHIKPDNIMVQIKDLSIIDRFLDETPVDPALLHDLAVLPSSIPSCDLGGYYITGSTNDLDICLGDWGAAGWSREQCATPIQPVLLRAPEVVISAPWGPAVDIWNLGAVLLELVDGVHMFDARNGRNGKYDVKKHVEEMVRLFGRFPRSLLDRGNRDVVSRCFHDDGSVVQPEREGTARLEDWVVNLVGEEKEAFIAFLRTVMVIDPEKRKTAAELVDEPWLLSTSQGEASSSID